MEGTERVCLLGQRSCPPPSTSLLTYQQFINCAFLENTSPCTPLCVPSLYSCPRVRPSTARPVYMIRVPLTPNGQSVITNVHLDTGGSQNLTSEHLLHNVKKAEDYGHNQIYMVTVNGNSPAYDRMGELNFNDEDGTPIIILCYVQV